MKVFVQKFEKLTVARLLVAARLFGCLPLFVRVFVQWLRFALEVWLFRVLVQVCWVVSVFFQP